MGNMKVDIVSPYTYRLTRTYLCFRKIVRWIFEQSQCGRHTQNHQLSQQNPLQALENNNVILTCLRGQLNTPLDAKYVI